LFALRLDLNETLKSGGRGMIGGRGHQRFRQVLIVGQFALAMVLLAGAGLLVRGLHDLNHRRAGWTSDHLIVGTLLLPAANYSDAEKITAFHRLALERLAALPGVSSVGISAFAPFFYWNDTQKVVAEGQTRPERGREPAVLVNSVSPGYFDTVGTRLLSGRDFNEHDTAASPRVIVLSEATARGLFGDESPVGRRLARIDGDNLDWAEIVGVVRDVRPVDPEPGPLTFQVYQPMAQQPGRQAEIVVRTNDIAPSSILESIRSTIGTLDPDLPVRRLQSANTRIDRANYQLGVLRDMLASFAILGLGLASLGIYGTIARTMAQRSGEFAIRLALGACMRDLTRLVLASGVKLALLGSALGLLGAFGVAHLLAAGFPGLQIDSFAILVATTLLLVAVALAACWLPARRTGKIDAMSVLRAE
jgi:predicted permease